MSTACRSCPLHKKTILRRAMTAWHLEDITPLRTSQEAEKMKEKRKRKAQITFLAPSVESRCPMLAFRLFEYLICFGSYQACNYTVTKPRTWPTCWSSSAENWLRSHGDIHPAIQTFILLVTMEPTLLLAHYSTIAADHNYTLLKGQPLSQLPDTSWYISSLPAPPIPFVLGQHVLLLTLPSRIFFDCLRSIIRLERSYLIITVSPEPTAYGPCLPHPCQVFLPILFMILRRLWWIQHTYLAHLLADDIYECCESKWVIWVGHITQTQHQQRTMKRWVVVCLCGIRGDLLMGRGMLLHQRDDAHADRGHSWRLGVMGDNGGWCLELSQSLGSAGEYTELNWLK